MVHLGHGVEGGLSPQSTGLTCSSTAARTTFIVTFEGGRPSTYPPPGPRVLFTRLARAHFDEELFEIVLADILAGRYLREGYGVGLGISRQVNHGEHGVPPFC